MRLRELNQEGVDRFEAWLADGALGETPLYLTTDSTTSTPVTELIDLSPQIFADRYHFGKYLVDILAPLDSLQLSTDRRLWTTLALIWLDQLCPRLTNGTRKLDQSYRYVLSADYRHYYRHLVRSPWQLVKDHGENAKFLLLPTADSPHPLRRHGEILEQLGGRQSVLRSQSVVAEASRLYSNPKTGRPRKGVAGNGRGSVRRLALVLRQLDLTFDVEAMDDGKLLSILPTEFDRWKSSTQVTEG